MCRPGNNFLLVMPVQIHEVVAVASNPYQEVTILIGFGLGPAKGVGIDHIELNVMTVQVEIGPE